jgi:hypothetical protein
MAAPRTAYGYKEPTGPLRLGKLQQQTFLYTPTMQLWRPVPALVPHPSHPYLACGPVLQLQPTAPGGAPAFQVTVSLTPYERAFFLRQKLWATTHNYALNYPSPPAPPDSPVAVSFRAVVEAVLPAPPRCAPDVAVLVFVPPTQIVWWGADGQAVAL